MRLVTYRHDGADHAGTLEGDEVTPLRGIAELGPQIDLATVAELRDDDHSVAFNSVELRPVIPSPPRIFCVGLNYHSHVGETGREKSEYPVLFCKFASSLIAAGEPIMVPPESSQVDYEAELAVVIGQGGRRIRREDAQQHVLGYTIANDVTMRDYQYKTHQWLQGKAWDRSTPLGPYLATPDEVDPAALAISLRLNGTELQASSTAQLMFDIPTLIATVSEFTALQPGDVILTGTPGGVGFRRDPQVFLTDGDIVEVSIDGLGTLRNPIAVESP